jgi:hypothetical protein
MKIRVYIEEDRLKVAAVLVKNGYSVKQGKEPRPGTKAVDYYLIAEDVRGNEKNESHV